jgi:hypothetical protein
MKSPRYFLLAAILAGACTSNDTASLGDAALYSDEMAMSRVAAASPEAQLTVKEAPSAASTMPPSIETENRMLIKTGTLSLKVEDYDSARVYILARVEQADGYIASENETNDPYRKQGRMTIRTPAAQFDVLIEDLAAIAEWVQSKNVTSRDVTEEFVDQEARLRTKKAVEARFLNILSTASTVKDILAVENEMRKLREEIESTEGRLKYLRNQVSLSTINLSYYQDLKAGPAPGQSFFGKLARAFGDGFQRLLGLVLGLVRAWPWILVLLVILFVARRVLRRRRSAG